MIVRLLPEGQPFLSVISFVSVSTDLFISNPLNGVSKTDLCDKVEDGT